MNPTFSRKVVGVHINWQNPRHGERKADDTPESKAHFNMEGFGGDESAILEGRAQFNTFLEKNVVIANITPVMEAADGTRSDLFEGDPENGDPAVVCARYTVYYDGQPYDGDDIEVSNHGVNFGKTIRLVFGPGLSGNHTLGFGVRLASGHEGRTAHDLKLNG